MFQGKETVEVESNFFSLFAFSLWNFLIPPTFQLVNSLQKYSQFMKKTISGNKIWLAIDSKYATQPYLKSNTQTNETSNLARIW